MNTNQLIIYRNFKYQRLFDDMAQLLFGTREGELALDPCALANELIELAAEYGFEGNLWHCFLAFCLANHENAYSISCEIRGDQGGTLSRLARQDFALIWQLYKKDIRVLDKLVPESFVWSELASFEPAVGSSRIFNRRIRDRIIKLSLSLAEAESVEAFAQAVGEFYREFGVGKFGLNKAFRIEEDRHTASIEPVVNVVISGCLISGLQRRFIR